LTVSSGVARAAVIGLLLMACPRAADADWIFAPFIGSTFAGSTALPDLEQGASSAQLIFGGTVGLWTRGIFGIETDFSYAPRFFETNDTDGAISGDVVVRSYALTWGGNIVVATPVSVTRESLRPYLVAGLGWMRASIEDVQGDVLEEFLGGRARNSVALNFGGGAIGFITPRTGVRFEVRHFRSLEHDEAFLTEESQSLLSFWRATVGVVIRR
jgi:hypothetical protein